MIESVEFNIMLPPDLRGALEASAAHNRRSVSAEVTFAADRYLAANATDEPPAYTGSLQRVKVWLPYDVHARMIAVASKRRWSRSRTYMAAIHRHLAGERR